MVALAVSNTKTIRHPQPKDFHLMNAIVSAPQALSHVENLDYALAELTDLDKILDLRDKTAAILQYMKSASAGLELQNKAAEAKLQCERRMGEILSEMRLKGGDRKSQRRHKGQSLTDLGISRSQSARWQMEAMLPEDEFMRFVQQTNSAGRELTSSGLVRLAKLHVRTQVAPVDARDPFARIVGGLRCLARQHAKFACVYADPPWSHVRGRAENVRLPKRLCQLPVKEVMEKNAHAHLWIPPNMIESGLTILRAWGFRCRDCLVRSKLPDSYGSHWRPAHDILLLGVRGKLPFRDTDLTSWLDEQNLIGVSNGEIHSLIGRASSPPFLDLFSVSAPRGWIVPCA